MGSGATGTNREAFIITIRTSPEQIIEILRANNLFCGHGRLPSFSSAEYLKESGRKQILEYGWVERLEDNDELSLGISIASVAMVMLTAIASVPMYFGIAYADTAYAITLAVTGLVLLVALLRFVCLPQVGRESETGLFKSGIWHKHMPLAETIAWQKVHDDLSQLERISDCQLHLEMHTRYRYFGFVVTKRVQVGIVYATMNVTRQQNTEYSKLVLRVWES